MRKKSILITGCSSGIGLDAAYRLHNLGWQVFATCRKQIDCDRLKLDGLESFVLDYEDPVSIDSAVQRVINLTGGTLDALFNNGAYAIPGAVEDVSREAMRQAFEVNFFGWHDLIIKVIPIMRSQKHGRIINCSSVLGFIPMRWRGSYVATKYALEGLTDTLRLEMRDTNIKVILYFDKLLLLYPKIYLIDLKKKLKIVNAKIIIKIDKNDIKKLLFNINKYL